MDVIKTGSDRIEDSQLRSGCEGGRHEFHQSVYSYETLSKCSALDSTP